MTAEQYRAALADLGLTQNAGGELLGVDPRTSRKWANAERDIPPPAARFLRYLVRVGADPAKVQAMLDEAEPSKGAGMMASEAAPTKGSGSL